MIPSFNCSSKDFHEAALVFEMQRRHVVELLNKDTLTQEQRCAMISYGYYTVLATMALLVMADRLDKLITEKQD